MEPSYLVCHSSTSGIEIQKRNGRILVGAAGLTRRSSVLILIRSMQRDRYGYITTVDLFDCELPGHKNIYRLKWSDAYGSVEGVCEI